MFLSNVLADESRLYSGIGLESYYIDQPMSAINYGPSIQIGFKIEFSGSTYLRFGYGVEFTPMGSDDGGHWVAINNQNIFLGLGLPIYKEENNCITFLDIIKLKRIEDVLEKFYNSGRFIKSVEYLINSYFECPFEFYENLSDYELFNICQKICDGFIGKN